MATPISARPRQRSCQVTGCRRAVRWRRPARRCRTGCCPRSRCRRSVRRHRASRQRRCRPPRTHSPGYGGSSLRSKGTGRCRSPLVVGGRVADDRIPRADEQDPGAFEVLDLKPLTVTSLIGSVTTGGPPGSGKSSSPIAQMPLTLSSRTSRRWPDARRPARGSPPDRAAGCRRS